MNNIIFVILVIFGFSTTCTQEHEEKIRIGIIGAGIGGTSTAYYLQQLFGEFASIDVFEKERVGGRLANINIDGQEYEAGGSVMHPKNKYIVDFAEQFGFEYITPGNSRMALFGKDGVVVETSSWSLTTMAKFLWRYGLDIMNIEGFIKDLFFDKFYRIYSLQDAGLAFTTTEDLLRSMDESIVNSTRISLRDLMKEHRFSDLFINELVTAALRTNYGQTPDVHAFVGAVCLAGIEKGLWAVKGGNYQIPERLLKKSAATLINAKVTEIVLQKDSSDVSYEVQYTNTGDGKTNSREYDIVILATPLIKKKDQIKFTDFSNEIPVMDYHHTVALFVQGTPNSTTYGYETLEEMPQSVLTIDDTIFWNSYGKQSPVLTKAHLGKNSDPSDSDNMVSKIFLNKVPTEDQVKLLFSSRKDLRLVDWMAYPEYKPNMELLPFVLYDQLYYVNAIESAASTVEMEVIGARNVANLAFNHWNNILDKVDEFHIKSEKNSKQEL